MNSVEQIKACLTNVLVLYDPRNHALDLSYRFVSDGEKDMELSIYMVYGDNIVIDLEEKIISRVVNESRKRKIPMKADPRGIVAVQFRTLTDISSDNVIFEAKLLLGEQQINWVVADYPRYKQWKRILLVSDDFISKNSVFLKNGRIRYPLPNNLYKNELCEILIRKEGLESIRPVTEQKNLRLVEKKALLWIPQIRRKRY